MVLTGVRTPFQSDLLIALKIAATDRWTIGYTAGRVTSINAPVAVAGAPTSEGVEQITWLNLTETAVKLKNLDGIHGAAAWDRYVQFDTHARWEGDWTAFAGTAFGSKNNSRERTAAWHATADVMLESRVNGRMTSYVYDTRLWLTDTYGPANAACFNTTTRLPNGTCTAPAVAHTHTDFDTTLGAGGTQVPMTGLSATNFATNNFTGRPVSVGTATTASNFSFLWGIDALAGVTTDVWSTRLSGEINLPVGGAWGFWITMADAADKAALFIDDKAVIAYSAGANWACCGYVLYGLVPNGATAGLHKIRVDFSDGGGNATLQLNWDMPGVGNQVVATSSLAPRYGLATRSTVDDSAGAPTSVTHTRYDQGWDPANGLATSTVIDPAGVALTNSTSYDTLRRRATRTLPGGNTTTYSYYGNTEASPAGVTCPDGATIAAGINQAGALRSSTSPAPASGAAVVYTTVYDILGRPVASRVGADPWSCTTYDARGRVVKVSTPARGAFPARNVVTTYSDTAEPQTVVVSDAAGSVTTRTDLLGRTIESTDTTGAANMTRTVYDTVDRPVRVYGTGVGATATSAGLEYSYDRAGAVTQVRLDGLPVANPVYTPGNIGGELASVSYPSGAGNAGNGTAGVFARNTAGQVTSIGWTGPGAVAVTSSGATRSQSGRIIDETVDGVDPFTAGTNYVYDTAGRLVSARAAGGGFYEYTFAATGGCGANTAAGANSNRTTARVNTATVTTYCYDMADRLTSVTATTAPHNTYAGAIVYDARGNTTTIGGEELVYDGTDRHLATYAPNATSPRSSVVYQRDVADRLIARTSTVVSTITHRDTQTQTSGAATATTVTVTRPVGTVAGDVLVAAVVADGGTGVTVTAPAGWTLARPAQDQTTLIRTVVWTRTAGGTEPASYVFTLSAARKVTASVSAYAGVDPVTPVDVTAGVSSATAATVLNAPAVTTTGTYRHLLGVYGTRIAATFTPAAGVAERADRSSTGTGCDQTLPGVHIAARGHHPTRLSDQLVVEFEQPVHTDLARGVGDSRS